MTGLLYDKCGDKENEHKMFDQNIEWNVVPRGETQLVIQVM